MLESIDLSRKIKKSDYKGPKDELDIRLGGLQRRARELGVPVVIVFEGWDAAGKGTLINELILPLDPRGFDVHSTLAANEEEALRPFLWRFWTRTPARGRIAIFDRSWYRRVLLERAERKMSAEELGQSFEDIRSFERQLTDDGAVIVKLFLHIAKKEQKKRLQKLRDDPVTAWRVTKEDLQRHKRYEKDLAGVEEMLAETDSEYAPWTVVEATDRRFATLKMFETVARAMERGIAAAEARQAPQAVEVPASPAAVDPELRTSILEGLDLSKALDRDEYDERLETLQERARELEHEIYQRRIPVVIVYEGQDAAGKGGNIRRLTQKLDPRGYSVVPIGAPNDVEKAHHYLWRFWTRFPKAGHIAIFDRSWYGRVMVERVEGFCTPDEWRRAYREINEMEQHMTHFGAVVLKFWLQIDPAEQLRRFQQRQETEHKRWKITDEDWRNREKWDAYRLAIEEMLFLTSTHYAPWTVVESNCKWYARVKALQTVCDAIEERLAAAKDPG